MKFQMKTYTEPAQSNGDIKVYGWNPYTGRYMCYWDCPDEDLDTDNDEEETYAALSKDEYDYWCNQPDRW